MTHDDFQEWLDRYGAAWEAGDPDAAVRLFSPDAAYYETPFDAPMTGSAQIHKYWTEGAKNAQTDVKFQAYQSSLSGNTGFALWRASLRRVPSDILVELDGALSASFDGEGRCQEFREWWHRRETPPSAGTSCGYCAKNTAATTPVTSTRPQTAR